MKRCRVADKVCKFLTNLISKLVNGKKCRHDQYSKCILGGTMYWFYHQHLSTYEHFLKDTAKQIEKKTEFHEGKTSDFHIFWSTMPCEKKP